MHQRPHERLVVWQEAYQLCLSMYRLTDSFPARERFALVNQQRRSAYSVPMNIAEGNAKSSPKERAHFFEIAHGSLEELHCQCMLARDLLYLSGKDYLKIDEHIHRVSYLLFRIRQSLQ
ncbi:MAG: S23 ribosomal protein [Candidatus Peregrinibacteria bacterium Gr01-1014_25]|nr:MAG: S23 ribosomal protein [Candidatus Peregrinibacteria bacterium Gr01-1014_25]